MKRWPRFSSRGTTLIELAVTLALFAFLVLLAVPLGHAWVQSAHQRDASGMLTEGLGRAKALALRNSMGLTDQTLPVAMACLVGGKIEVASATKDGADCGQGGSWSAKLPFDVSIVEATSQSAFQCVAYNERGVALAATIGPIQCTPALSSGQPLTFNVLVGNEEALPVNLP